MQKKDGIYLLIIAVLFVSAIVITIIVQPEKSPAGETIPCDPSEDNYCKENYPSTPYCSCLNGNYNCNENKENTNC